MSQTDFFISPYYRLMNETLHATKGKYGKSGHIYAGEALALAREVGAQTLLDYGCGKATLAKALEQCAPDLMVAEYDPAIKGKEAMPGPADVVICTDVLEHIEPEYFPNVLGHLKALAQKALLIAVHTQPSVKSLPDGRNAHLIIQPSLWWKKVFEEVWAAQVSAEDFPLEEKAVFRVLLGRG